VGHQRKILQNKCERFVRVNKRQTADTGGNAAWIELGHGVSLKKGYQIFV